VYTNFVVLILFSLSLATTKSKLNWIAYTLKKRKRSLWG